MEVGWRERVVLVCVRAWIWVKAAEVRERNREWGDAGEGSWGSGGGGGFCREW